MATAVVLVEPSLPENVGAVARAMANFGLSDLRLVAPAAPPDHPRARAAATHGGDVLAAARVFDTLAEALGDRGRVWATSARRKELALPTSGPRALAGSLRAAEAAGERPAVVFGPERTGLRYEHLARAHGLVHVPTDPRCPALNLAQAVTLIAWERWAAGAPAEGADAALEPGSVGGGATDDGEAVPPRGPPPAPVAAFDAWFAVLTARIEAVGWLSEGSLRPRALRNLRAAFLRAGFTGPELRTLHGLVRALGRTA